ncbi:hypothetical protein [Megasphaera elsdenii]|uniref:hypothetical protein n=1 Tax=Megasphaera elsdenii TaxID=907 RepID=UPI002A7FCB5D|nr:hypothetical protein [Megasphaera elsdenii]MCI7199473.1 hypothetical protein [Megasphaera elsdenii]MDY4265641.1 hypothetical protein [Megasphaera elsdenii]
MCGKVGKAFGSIFGLGGSSTPTVPQTDPVATSVNVGDDTGSSNDDATTNAKKKRGFSSTQLRDFRSGLESILGNTNGKNTLG